jgi:hypothetical protein
MDLSKHLSLIAFSVSLLSFLPACTSTTIQSRGKTAHLSVKTDYHALKRGSKIASTLYISTDNQKYPLYTTEHRISSIKNLGDKNKDGTTDFDLILTVYGFLPSKPIGKMKKTFKSNPDSPHPFHYTIR